MWGGHGLHGSETPSGVLIGGADKGKVFVWNPDAVLRGTDPLIQQLNKHTGSVAALDINNFQVGVIYYIETICLRGSVKWCNFYK